MKHINKIMTRQHVILESDITSGLSILYSTLPGRCILQILVQPWVSKVAGAFLSTKLSTRLIPSFVRKNHIDLSEYREVEYTSFNDFFTREIKDGMRPFSKNPSDLTSPADSKLSIYPIDDACLLKVKNSIYTVGELLNNEEKAALFKGGYALVFRLCVDDYHRYAAIDTGSIKEHYAIPGIFHTVNPIATHYYPIYSQNSREVTIYETENFQTVGYIEVGAMMVGKILNLPHTTIERGNIKGYFEFGGSTVVLLFQKNSIQIDEDLLELNKQGYEIKLRMGETIGKKY